VRKARDVLVDLIKHTQPPRGCAVVLTEFDRTPKSNWVAAAGLMGTTANARYLEKLGELEKSDSIVDWSDEPTLVVGQRRVAHWLSEVD
jgi:hypothetical protein